MGPEEQVWCDCLQEAVAHSDAQQSRRVKLLISSFRSRITPCHDNDQDKADE